MSTPEIALFQPDIPQNAGTILRTAACLGVPVSVIGPTGFDMSDRALRRAGLDYIPHVTLSRFNDWASFMVTVDATKKRLVLASTHGGTALPDFSFDRNDIILLGRESAGVPEYVRTGVDAVVSIPVRPPLRSFNVAVATGMLISEALRQTGCFPSE